MDKENVVCSYSGILLSNQNEQTTDTCYDTNETQTFHTKWKKANAKDYILYDFIYIKCLEKQI